MNREEAFTILGIPNSSSTEEVKKAYRKLAVKYHPDKNQGNKELEEKFKQATAAYEILTKPQGEGVTSGGFNPADEMFQEFQRAFSGGTFRFSTGGGTRSRRPATKNPSQRIIRLEPAELVVSIDIETLLLRDTVNLKLQVECCCSECLGSAENWHPCQTCHQVGYTVTNTQTPVGNFMQEQVCNVCHGNGWVNSRHCKVCKDKIVHFKEKSISFKVPADFRNGSKIKLSGAGREGWNSPPADLYINPKLNIPDYSTLSEEDRAKLLEILGKK